jgi:Protein of unknown function (DUF3105)
MASRKEEKEKRRQERLARERAEQEQARRRRLYATVVGAVLVVAAIAAVVVVVAAGGGDGGSSDGSGIGVDGIPPPTQRITALDAAAKAADCRLRNPPIEGATHVQKKVKYKTNPPTSGNHNPVPADDEAYGTPPPVEKLVHALEHGRIIVSYKRSLPQRRIAQLKGLFDQDPYHLILASNNSMPYELAVTAWGHLAGCKKVSDESLDVLRAFRDRYRDKGPEFVP